MSKQLEPDMGPIKDSFKQLGVPRSMLLGLQHMFAMFGATILVPLITGLSVQVTLIGVGVGTLIFQFMGKGRVPVFLGSSFAFLAGVQLVTDPVSGIFAGLDMPMADKLAYATGGIFVAGFLYFLLAITVKLIGVKKVMRYLPPVVTGPIVILVGVMLAPFAISQSNSNMLLAIISLSVVIIAASWGKGMFKIIPIVLGLGGGYLAALILHFAGVTNPNGTAILDFAGAAQAGVVGLPPFFLPRFSLIPILVMIPAAIATIAEHIADMIILSDVCGENFTEKPGLTRTLIGDGLATTFSGLVGAPATTTYSENVGVVVLTKIHDARVVILAAFYATILGFMPIFAAIVYTIPTAVVGGVSFVLYGMIAAVGIRTLVDNRVDIGETRNLLIIAVVLVTGLGLRFGPLITVTLGGYSVPIDRLGIAIGALLGVFLNIVLPGEKFEFGKKKE
ncbi:MAG: uracil-xanthine permease family protein [Spirochaetes bacterium]|nr:uracil-xanthine permease family protein [Spirochaetota bacterium]